jgi:hypothetical protein
MVRRRHEQAGPVVVVRTSPAASRGRSGVAVPAGGAPAAAITDRHDSYWKTAGLIGVLIFVCFRTR